MTPAARPRSIISRPAWRRYMIRFTAAMASYIVVLLAVDYAARNGTMPAKPWLYLVAVAPAIPVACISMLAGRRREIHRTATRT